MKLELWVLCVCDAMRRKEKITHNQQTTSRISLLFVPSSLRATSSPTSTRPFNGPRTSRRVREQLGRRRVPRSESQSAGDCAGPLGLPCRRSRPLKTRFLHYHTSSNPALALSDPRPQDTLLSGPILLSLLLRTPTALNSNLSPGHPRPRPLFSLALLCQANRR